MMRQLATLIASAAVVGALSGAHGQSARTFDIYVIDVEGGEATLFVSPTGESLLVDAGWPGFDGRDADRIRAAARDAGITQIDHLAITHYHADHVGGTAQLAARLPIRHFVDRGANFSDDERTAYDAYSPVRGGGRRTEVKAGDSIAMNGIDVRVIAAGGSVMKAPLPGQGAANPFCADFKPQGPEITSRAADGGDSRSLSLFLTYGRFRTIILGDLTWNKEFELMCPNNPLGEVDVYLVSHHGSDTSGSSALVHALRPRAAIMNNGPRKGGAIQTFEILNRLPAAIDLWQNHYSVPGGQQHNRPEMFIANLDEGERLPGAKPGAAPVHTGAAHWIKVSARADGSFTISNSRTAFAKEYPAVVSGNQAPSGALSEDLRARVKDERFQLVTSIRGLPLGVREELQTLFGSPDLDIAEPDAEFQTTDATASSALPSRRLVAAGCSIRYCLVYYERGGSAHTWQVALFHWTPDKTRLEWGGNAPGGLTTIDAVRSAILSGAIKGPATVW
jgi:competence protein ComEC